MILLAPGSLRWTRIVAATIIVATTTSTRAFAQTPAPPPRLSGASLSGIVRDAGGTPLPDVNVTLVGETAATRTDTAGAFILRDISPGLHTVLFRRIGYRSVDYRWPARAGVPLQANVTMTPAPRTLDRVVVEAPASSRRRGTSSIGGTVNDSTGKPVAGADVRLIGSGLSTVTDSMGRFQFALLAAGSYVVRVRDAGLLPASTFMQILDEDDRGIGIKMYDLPEKAGARANAPASNDGFYDASFDALDRRTRSGPTGILIGPADLIRANRLPLDALLEQYRVRSSPQHARRMEATNGLGSTDDNDCLLLDGRRPVYRPLHTFSSVEAQLVEVFRANAFVDEYVVSQMDALAECRGSVEHHPPYFVLWTRSVR